MLLIVYMGKTQAKKVLLIGWDGADWKAINPLIDAGKMPALERFINAGVMGKLATLHPPLSPMLWTSIATGMRPFKHGIHGFTEPDPHTGGIRPVTSTSRKTKAIWNIFSQKGIRSNVIGWWPSHPAEPINGVMVSNHFQRTNAPMDKPWPMLPGTVHPERLSKQISELRIHPAEITAQQVFPFIPRAAEIDQDKDPRLGMACRILANCSTIHACATAVMQLEPWDFMAVYYDAMDHFGHGFMKYHPPRQEHISEEDFELYKGVVEAGYRFHDMMLGVLLKLAGEETTVILISDHGFHPDDLRPARIPHEPAGPAVEHSPYGIFAMKGPGIKRDELIYGASLLDIAPTILTMLGLPVGEDMDGQPLLQCFEILPAIKTIPSWEGLAGEDGRHPPDQRLDPAEAREAINHLVDLEYIEDPGEDKDKAVKNTVHEARYNLAQAYIDANRYMDALPIFKELWEAEPDELRFGNRLAHCYMVLDRLSECRGIIESMIQTQGRLAREAREKLQEYAHKQKEAIKEDRSASEEMTEENKAEKQHQEIREKRKIDRLRALARPRKYWADYLMGCLLLAEEKPASALERLQRAEQAEPRLPHLHQQIGQIYLKLKQWEDADRAFSRTLEIDPDNAQAHLGRCQSLLPRRLNMDAAEEALEAVGRLYHFPQAHFNLGVALHRVGYIDRAVEALQVVLSQNPNFIDAHKRLAYIYGRRLNDPEKATYHRDRIREIRKRGRGRKTYPKTDALPSLAAVSRDYEKIHPKTTASTHLHGTASYSDVQDGLITVVSGLPRSGTSMLMQMLLAGGYSLLTDSVRGADDDNPRGYFEFNKVKRLRNDTSWLSDAGGKAVKIIAQLLPFLPAVYPYRVIFMERYLVEVLNSQMKMLERQGRKGANLSQERLGKTFAQQVSQVKSMLDRQRISVLYVSHRETLECPMEVAGRIANFLGEDLNIEAMVGAVNSSLYRSRSE